MNQRTPNLNANISRIVRTLLAHQHRCQAELAAALGMDTGSMSRSMNGSRKWTVDDLGRMSAFFDVSVSLFFEDADSIVKNRCDSPVTRELVAA